MKSVCAMKQLEESPTMTIETNDGTTTIEAHCGFLADPTGSGKTITMLEFIRDRYGKLKMRQDQVVNHRNYGMFVSVRSCQNNATHETYLPTTIVVVSPNIVNQWVRECKRYLGFEPPHISTISEMRSWFNLPSKGMIVIVNENRMKVFSVCASFRSIAFARCVYDESRHLKFFGTTTSAPPAVSFTWFINARVEMEGRPRAEMFFPRHVRSVVHASLEYLTGPILSMLTIENEESAIRYPGRMDNIYYNCKTTSQVTDIAMDQLDSDLRAKIQTGDIAGALQVMGAEEQSNIMSVVTNRLEESLSQLALQIQQLDESKSRGLVSETAYEAKSKSLKERRSTIQRQLNIANARFQDLLATGICSICLEGFTDPAMVTCCCNVFCAECFIKSQTQAKKCPMCRSLSFAVHRVSNDGRPYSEAKPKDVPLSKFDVVQNILLSEVARRTIVYSETEYVLAFLNDVAKETGAKILKLSGFQSSRARAIDEFKTSGEKTILFANALSDCSGIDIPEATDIILWHEMSREATKQIIGRCRRVSSNENDVHRIHHLYKSE